MEVRPEVETELAKIIQEKDTPKTLVFGTSIFQIPQDQQLQNSQLHVIKKSLQVIKLDLTLSSAIGKLILLKKQKRDISVK